MERGSFALLRCGGATVPRARRRSRNLAPRPARRGPPPPAPLHPTVDPGPDPGEAEEADDAARGVRIDVLVEPQRVVDRSVAGARPPGHAGLVRSEPEVSAAAALTSSSRASTSGAPRSGATARPWRA